MSQLYDRTDIYDLVESDQRTEIIRKDWADFLGDREIHTLLDVSIGTGSMTLALQELGISLCGSDLSEAMLSRCETKAAAKGKPVELKCSDFRDLSCWEGRQFDCVASTGNSLGYVENNDVLLALEKMDRLVKPGGYLCYDSRNWEKIRRDKQRFYLYNPFFRDGAQRMLDYLEHTGTGTGSTWSRSGTITRTVPSPSTCCTPLKRITRSSRKRNFRSIIIPSAWTRSWIN